MEVRVDTQINAPPDTVYETALDIPAWPQIISAITKIEMLSDGPVAVGTSFRETRVMFGREATEDMTISTLEPPRRFVFTAENHGTSYVVEHLLAPENGGTRFSVAFSGKANSFLARVMLPLGLLMAGTVKKQLAGDLEDLKRAIEIKACSRG